MSDPNIDFLQLLKDCVAGLVGNFAASIEPQLFEQLQLQSSLYQLLAAECIAKSRESLSTERADWRHSLIGGQAVSHQSQVRIVIE